MHIIRRRQTSFGYKFEYWRSNEFTLNLVQINSLIRRWNKPKSQANFYIKSAIGSAYSDKAKFEGKKLCWFFRIISWIGRTKDILFNMVIVTLMLWIFMISILSSFISELLHTLVIMVTFIHG